MPNFGQVRAFGRKDSDSENYARLLRAESHTKPESNPFFGCWNNGTVARLALPRRGLVEAHGLACSLAHQLMAVVTTHVDVSSLQRKGRTVRVVEGRRLPLRHIVAAIAGGHFLRLGKLPVVYFVVAIPALSRSSTKIYVN